MKSSEHTVYYIYHVLKGVLNQRGLSHLQVLRSREFPPPYTGFRRGKFERVVFLTVSKYRLRWELGPKCIRQKKFAKNGEKKRRPEGRTQSPRLGYITFPRDPKSDVIYELLRTVRMRFQHKHLLKPLRTDYGLEKK